MKWYRLNKPFYSGGDSSTYNVNYIVTGPVYYNDKIYGTPDNLMYQARVTRRLGDTYYHLYPVEGYTVTTNFYRIVGSPDDADLDWGEVIEGDYISGVYQFSKIMSGSTYNGWSIPLNYTVTTDGTVFKGNCLQAAYASNRYYDYSNCGFSIRNVIDDTSVTLGSTTNGTTYTIPEAYINFKIDFGSTPQPIPKNIKDFIEANAERIIPAYESTPSAFYSYSSERNRINKEPYLTKVGDLTGTFREDIDILHPVIRYASEELPAFNYVGIEKLKRYYFVDNIKYIAKNLWEVYLTVDPLYTYKSTILNCQAFVTRNQYTYNKLLTDSKRVIEGGATYDTIDVPNSVFDGSYTYTLSGLSLGVIRTEKEDDKLPTPIIELTGGTASVTNYGQYSQVGLTYQWYRADTGKLLTSSSTATSFSITAWAIENEMDTGDYGVYLKVLRDGVASPLSNTVTYSYTASKPRIPTPTFTITGKYQNYTLNISHTDVYSEFPTITWSLYQRDGTSSGTGSVVKTFTGFTVDLPSDLVGTYGFSLKGSATGCRDSYQSTVTEVTYSVRPKVPTPEFTISDEGVATVTTNYSDFEVITYHWTVTEPDTTLTNSWTTSQTGTTDIASVLTTNDYPTADITVTCYVSADDAIDSDTATVIYPYTKPKVLPVPTFTISDTNILSITNKSEYSDFTDVVFTAHFLSVNETSATVTFTTDLDCEAFVAENMASSIADEDFTIRVKASAEGQEDTAYTASVEWSYPVPKDLPVPTVAFNSEDTELLEVTNASSFPSGVTFTLWLRTSDEDVEITSNTTGSWHIEEYDYQGTPLNEADRTFRVMAEKDGYTTSQSVDIEYTAPVATKSAVGTWVLNSAYPLDSGVATTFYVTGSIDFTTLSYSSGLFNMYIFGSGGGVGFSRKDSDYVHPYSYNVFYFSSSSASSPSSSGSYYNYGRNLSTSPDYSSITFSSNVPIGTATLEFTITGGNDAENPELVAWLEANATKQS